MSNLADIQITLPDGTTAEWYVGHRRPTHAVVRGYSAERYAVILADRIASAEQGIAADESHLRALMIDNTADVAGRFYRQMCSYVPGIWTADPETVRSAAIDHIMRRLDGTCDRLRDLVSEAAAVAAAGEPVGWQVVSTHGTLKAATAAERKVALAAADRNGFDLHRIITLAEAVA